jgi:predicted Zn-dependent protease
LSSLPDPKDKIEEQNLLHSAMMLVDERRSPDARLLLEKVLLLNPDSHAALRQLGELEFDAADYRKAADHLAHAREKQPDDPLAAFYEGQSLDKLGDSPGARKALEDAVKQSPGQLDARLLLARIDLKSGDRAAAEDQLEAVLVLNPANQEAVLLLAAEYLRDRRFADVVDLLEPTAQDASVSADALQLLGQAYVGLGRTSDAERVQTRVQALKQRP